MSDDLTHGAGGQGGQGGDPPGENGGGSPPGDGGGGGLQVPTSIEEELQTSYLAYSMSVIIGRALPDVRDGLKPVHRRLLFTMHELSNRHNQPYKKSARIVGETMGKYHPHGDAALYDALVRMAQDFSMRYLLVDGQGNFGSVDGDPPAAMRYTEVRLSRLADELLLDLEKETVDFVPNYNDEMQEPTVLPAKAPNLILNGADGIAVGMATKIPPHNLGEITEALQLLIRDPDAGDDEIIALVPGPDFPTGGLILGRQGIDEAYRTGRGSITMRGRAEIEVEKRGERTSIVITELPFQVNKARLLESLAELVRDKKIEGISDIRDESDRDGIRAVVILKRDAVPQVVLNNLFQHTALQQNFGINMVAIVGGRPKTLTLREILVHFLEHRREVVTRRSAFELRQAEARAHILEGLKIALDHIDEVVALIRASKDTAIARSGLMTRFGLSERQANAILDMRLARLTGLERDKLTAELRELYMLMERLNAILGDDKLLMGVISDELKSLQADFGDPRKTEIVAAAQDIDHEDLIVEEDMAVTVTQAGYVKRTPVTKYRAQGRGGKGVTGLATKDEDVVVDMFVASTHATLLILTDRGRIFRKKVYELPLGTRTARGRPIVNLVPLEQGESVAAFIAVTSFETGGYLMMCTRSGAVKKTELGLFANIRQTGIRAITIDEGDEVIAARLTTGNDDILIGTADGQCIRFNAERVRPMGRVARGVRGISLREGDRVVAMTPAAGGKYLLTVCERGYGKRTLLDGYPTKNRGGLGNITIKTTQRNGKVVGLLVLDDEDHVVIVTSQGKIIRLRAKSISVLGRNTQGVRMVSIEGDEKVVAIAKVVERDVGADEAVDALETADASEVAAAAAADAEDPDTDPGTDSLGGDVGDEPDGDGGNGTGGGGGEEG